MPTYYDSTGKSYVLDQQIGRGGEGTVFYCPNDPELVAKIYHEPIDDGKAEKLRWMAQNNDEHLFKVAAWIVETLHDESGKTVGFLMQNVRAKEIHELYSLKSRRVYFPDANWQFLIHTAANVARAFYVLHKNDHIMGDVNHGNCVVLADGTVKLIDCDSYSIKTDKLRYPCEVGVATHLAPELQGADLGETEREKTHDNFGLAVIIFQLLFLGRHPFAGNYLGAEDKSLEDCIRERRFAYGNQESTNVKQPPGTLSLSAVSPRIAIMLERAFLTNDRPEPHEWIEALEDLSASLKQCSVHIEHHYFNALLSCPWCEIEAKTGLMLFPFVSSGQSGNENGFNIFTVESLLASLDIPQNLPVKPFKTTILPPPSPDAKELRITNQQRFIGIALLQFFIVVFLTGIAGAGVGFFLGAILLVGFLVTLHNTDKSNYEYFEDQLNEARQNWNKLEGDWNKNLNGSQLNEDIELVRKKVSEHHVLQKQSRDKVKRLNEELFQYKLNSHLASFKLADLKIAGIEEHHRVTFQNLKLQTAADIDKTRLNFLAVSIDEKTRETLSEWRKTLEADFEFNPETELPEAEKNRLEGEFVEKRRNIERDIEQLLVSLRSGALMLRQNQKMLVNKAETFAQKLLQSESDVSTIGNSTTLTVVLVVMTVFIPIIGATFQSSNKTNVITQNKSYSDDFDKVSVQKAPVKVAPEPNVSTDRKDNYQVTENLTDQQIKTMAEDTRERSARSLYKQAVSLINESSDYSGAEKKLRYAVRFKDDDTEINFQLADVLFEQGKYAESLKLVDNVNEFSKDDETRILIGKNYVKLGRFKDAVVAFNKLAPGDLRKSFDGNFYLAKAYKGLKKYEMAAKHFGEAINLEPGDAEATYELAYCYFKNGDRKSAQIFYESLVYIDYEKAEELRRLANLDPIPPPTTKTIESSGSGYGTGSGTGYGIGRGSGN